MNPSPKPSSILFLILGMTLLTFSVPVSGKRGKMRMNITCKGEPINSDMKMLKERRQSCMKELNLTASSTSPPTLDPDGPSEGAGAGGVAPQKGENKMRGMRGCLHLCMLKQENIIGPDGAYNPEGAEQLITSMYPTSVQPDITSGWGKCASAVKFSMEDNCAGVAKFKRCLSKSAGEACGFPQRSKGWKDKNKGEGAEEGMSVDVDAPSEES